MAITHGNSWTHVAELEARNRELEKAAAHATPKGRKGRARSILALVLVLVGTILAPAAVLGTWARVQLIDTDRFVQTFAPLAESPEVQSLVTDQVVAGIEENLDFDRDR